MGINFKIQVYILTVFIFLLTACEKKIDWQLPDETLNTIVVESILTSEFKNQEVKLSFPSSNQNAEIIPVSGATITISNGTDDYSFTEVNEESGIYLSDEKFAATINRTYQLNIQYDTSDYQASTTMISVSNFSEPQFSYADTAGNLKISWVAPTFDTEQAMYEVRIDWSSIEYDTNYYNYDQALMYRYTFNTIDVNYTIFPPTAEDLFFPQGSQVTVTKYSLTDDYADFIRGLVAETEWQGSIFEEARGNAQGNISNGGLGYFSACSIISISVDAFP